MDERRLGLEQETADLRFALRQATDRASLSEVKCSQFLAAGRRWTPVSEKLPDPGDSVLVFHRATDPDGTPSCMGCDGNGGLIDTAMFDRIEGEDLWVTDQIGHIKPTHWMPLPEPPEVT